MDCVWDRRSKTLSGWPRRCKPSRHNKWKNSKRNDERSIIYVLGLGINLYSIGTATDAGVQVLLSDNTVSFSRDGTVIMEGRRSRKEALYYLDIQAEEHNIRTEKALVSAHFEPLSLWHQRLGHLNYKKVLNILWPLWEV
jgi:hypothetical protein